MGHIAKITWLDEHDNFNVVRVDTCTYDDDQATELAERYIPDYAPVDALFASATIECESFAYPTGRDYGTPQVLDITIESVREDELGDRHVTALFVDAARNIAGRVKVLVLSFETHFLKSLGAAVKDAYDHGRYQLLDI